jgi:hypothetical protein
MSKYREPEIPAGPRRQERNGWAEAAGREAGICLVAEMENKETPRRGEDTGSAIIGN